MGNRPAEDANAKGGRVDQPRLPTRITPGWLGTKHLLKNKPRKKPSLHGNKNYHYRPFFHHSGHAGKDESRAAVWKVDTGCLEGYSL